MKYTYQISFNGSDYSDLSLTDVQMSGEWIEGTKIWRENISELKITKAENSSIYDTLETWYTDSTKFTTRIFVKIYKNSVEDSTHWFGIKWGKINRETKTYEVQPLAYDLWGRYFETVVDREYSITTNDNNYRYYDTSTYHVYIGVSSDARRFIDQIREIVDVSTDFVKSDVVSSFIGTDDYEDGSTVDDEYGIRKDYVTDEQSYMDYAGAFFPLKMSINDFNSLMQLYNVICFIDSNNKLRYEHIKYFTDKLIDNAVDYSTFINDYDKVWSYDTVNIPTTEKITMRIEDGQTDNDFIGYPIIYSEIRNRSDVQTYEYITSYFSDLEYYNDNSLTYRGVLFSSSKNKAYKWYELQSLSSYAADKNYLTLVGGGGTQYVGSNDFVVTNTTAYNLTVDADALPGASEIILQIYDRSSGAAISNAVTISSTGVTNDTLTATATANDAYLRLTLDPGTSEFTGYIILEEPNDNFITVPTITGLTSSSVRTNGAFSVSNIFNFWWQENRLSRSGTYNGDTFNFNNTQYNLRRDDIRIHYSGVINPLYGFNDGTRVGMIEKWERDLDTDYYTISVIYQEDE